MATAEERQAKWRAKHPGLASERARQWKLDNPDRAKETYKKWYAKNKNKLKRQHSEYLRAHRNEANKRRRDWCVANPPERASQHSKKWRAANPGIANEAVARRRAKIKETAVFLTKEDKAKVRALYVKAKELGSKTGLRYHVDHIVPVKKGGKHHPNNLQVLLAVENQRKSSRDPVQYMMS